MRPEGYFTSTFAMVEGVKQPSKTDRLATRMRRYASAEQLILMRNLGYGGAAACLVILVQLAQVGAGEIPLKVTVVATSVSLPLWLMLGATYELYIFLGTKSYPHLRTKFAANFFGLAALAAGVALVVAIGGLIWYLMPDAVWVFASASVVCVVLAAVFNALLARWWFGPEGPGSSEPEDDI